MKRCHSVALSCIDVCCLFQQCTHQLEFTLHCRVRYASIHYWCCGIHEKSRQNDCRKPHSAISPVLSPKLSRPSIPSRCRRVRNTFAIGVESGALMWTLPLSCPQAWPARNNGHRLWLCTFGFPIGDPYMTTELSNKLPSTSAVFLSFSRKYGIVPTW